jgi:hypothetical protein
MYNVCCNAIIKVYTDYGRGDANRRGIMEDGNNKDRGPCILTRSGQDFYFLDPSPEDIIIDDVAHALSLQCRFNGHCQDFYSVAEHSVWVSRYLERTYGDKELALCGLLHDAAEAYLGDVVSPLKKLLPEYVRIESNIERCIASRFGLVYPFPKEVYEADRAALAEEFSSLAPFCEPDKAEKGMTPKRARKLFMNTFKNLTRELGYDS